MAKEKAGQAGGEKKKKIESKELLVVDEGKPAPDGRFHKIRVVQWTIDDVKHPPKLEKRGFYKGKRDETLTGDHETFMVDDVKKIAEKMPQILEAMEAGLF